MSSLCFRVRRYEVEQNSEVDGRGEELVMLDWGKPEEDKGEQFALIGKIVSRKILNKLTVKSPIQKAWNLKEEVVILDTGENQFIFSFEKQGDMERVIRDSPWTVTDFLLVLKEWSPMLSIGEVDLTICDIWVQFHGVPLEGMASRNALKLGGKVGRVITYEDLHCNVRISRSFVQVGVKYEKLQHYCFKCGRFGHDAKFWEEEKAWLLFD